MAIIGDLNEDQLIRLFAPRLPVSDAEILGPGDDAALLAVDGDLVVSTDVLVEGQHFRTEWSRGADVGYRAAVQNLADIDAMGAVPTALQIGLIAPPHTPVDWVLEFADGLYEACAPHGVGVSGGDLSAGPVIMVSVTAIGETHGVEVVTRGDAEVGDLVAVSGPLGASAAGWAALSADAQVSSSPAAEAAIALFKRPQIVVGQGLEAALLGATAMLDVSDGLGRDAGRIGSASQVRLELDSSLIPIHPAAVQVAKVLRADPLVWALSGGEDHQLLATFPAHIQLPPYWTVIGAVAAMDHDSPDPVWIDGQRPDLPGWDHFQLA